MLSLVLELVEYSWTTLVVLEVRLTSPSVLSILLPLTVHTVTMLELHVEQNVSIVVL